VLTTLFGFDFLSATGTSLAALLMPVSIFAVIAYYRAGKLRLSVAAPSCWADSALAGRKRRVCAAGQNAANAVRRILSYELALRRVMKMARRAAAHGNWRPGQPRAAPRPLSAAGRDRDRFRVIRHGGGLVIVPIWSVCCASIKKSRLARRSARCCCRWRCPPRSPITMRVSCNWRQRRWSLSG
jgi:hypothetical protein